MRALRAFQWRHQLLWRGGLPLRRKDRRGTQRRHKMLEKGGGERRTSNVERREGENEEGTECLRPLQGRSALPFLAEKMCDARLSTFNFQLSVPGPAVDMLSTLRSVVILTTGGGWTCCPPDLCGARDEATECPLTSSGRGRPRS